MNDIFSVKDLVVIVTGAARGNGKAIAEGFVHSGSKVYFVDVADELDMTVTNLNSDKAVAVYCDLKDETALASMINRIDQENGGINVLVNNAGISLSGEDPYADSLWDETLQVNLKAAFLMSKMVCQIMSRNEGGSVINITSLGASMGFPDNPSYQASKGALRQLTRAMARDWGKFNIRFNNVCPGYIRTQMTTKSYNEPSLRLKRSERMILQRWGEPDDLVGACIFLASQASSYITGTDIVVDGGWMANGL